MDINNKIEDNFDIIIKNCENIFTSKLEDYSISWLEYRMLTVIDHILIKALRIKTIEENGGVMLIQEDCTSEYLGIINYCLIALILYNDKEKLPSPEQIITKEHIEIVKESYFKNAKDVRELLIKKNHDYGNAWKNMEVTSFTDIIIARIYRMKTIIKSSKKNTITSEGIDAQLMDIINYCVFALVILIPV